MTGLTRFGSGNEGPLEVRRLLERTGCGPYRYLLRHAREQIHDYWWEQWLEFARSADHVVYLARDGNEARGAIGFARLPWESGLFGKKMGGISFLLSEDADVARGLIDAVLEQARQDGFDFVSCKVYTDEMKLIHALQAHGFLLVDTMLEHGLELGSDPVPEHPPPPDDGLVIRLADSSDLKATMRMVEACFAQYFGRFHSDPRIPREDADRVYTEWVRGSFGDYADYVLLAEIEGRIVGCTVWRKLSPIEEHGIRAANYSLSTVHPDHAGKGLATRLSLCGIDLFREQGFRFIEALTHINNLAIERTLRASGFKIVDGRHTFHLWLDGAQRAADLQAVPAPRSHGL